MTREEAIKLAIKACEETWNEKTCKQIRKALEQEPCDKYINEIDHLRKYISKLETQIVEQEPKYCDRNICVSNEYNGIGCDECEVTKSQEPSGDLIRRQVEFDLCNMRDKYKVKNVITVNPQEPKTGHWINYCCAVTNERWYACSRCRSEVKLKTDYCPNCYVKMVDADEDYENERMRNSRK